MFRRYAAVAALSTVAVVALRPGTVSGGLWIVPGSAQRLRTAAIRHLNQSSAGVPRASTPGDEFAGALAVGEINGDGRADLAVGVPGKDLGAASQAGGPHRQTLC